MKILQNVSLKLFSTMRLGGTALYECEVQNEQDLLEALDFAKNKNIPFKIIGLGSNIIWNDSGFNGLLIVNKLLGFNILDDGVTVRIGAGTNWDYAVEQTVLKGLSGFESLSAIPGTVGATPVQNVGAYGSEVKDTIVSVRCYDTQQNKFVGLSNKDCEFGYRTSRFKTTDSGRFIITSITFKLSLDNPKPPFYESLQSYLDDNNIIEYTALNIRKAVIDIRSKKMPDSNLVANNGSFFSNPIISKQQFNVLLLDFKDIKYWDIGDDNIKISAAWLIEQSGFKNFHDPKTGMATWANQSLVLVNESAINTSQLLEFKQNIVNAVQDKFNITLEQEPELVS
ncbi:MAG: UDP-N-acetylmuramate dehydrogenase [bacterium]